MANDVSSQHVHQWALVLAAGEGSRLKELTTTHEGVAIPKQFCSLRGRRSLLLHALDRASAVVAPERVCAVVATEHQPWWSVALRGLPRENVIPQVRNKGTAMGILLPLLRILARDPHASLLVLPSDHFVFNEAVLTRAIRTALSELEHRPDELILLGIEPDEFDTELGYIVPAAGPTQVSRPVMEFIEKPPAAAAVRLLEAGALWNSFIFVAKAAELLERFRSACTACVEPMERIAALDPFDAEQYEQIAKVYAALPTVDFSRTVLQRHERLSVMQVPACGWNDLGTPNRVAQTLARVQPQGHERSRLLPPCAFLDLSMRIRLV